MKLNHILLFSFMVLFISSCLEAPELKPYVPKKNVKTVYVTKDVPQSTKKSITNQPPGSGNNEAADTNKNRSPSLKITDLNYEPNPLPVNTAFDIICRFKPDIPQTDNNTIPVIFYFKVYRGSKVLFTSKHYTVNTKNNKVKKWVQHMNAISKKGTYKFKAFVKYNDISDNQSINIKIE
ncbi:MAG: hypothetical protein PF690_08055 [Deltaproteobacteria bacterium]|jgi:hypothetical protein|nr:hypothetical protein [Deltaproteobacteria bacterium]